MILFQKAVGLYKNANDPETNFLLRSQNIRAEAANGMDAREKEFQRESLALGRLIDVTEPKLEGLSIADINEQVCGASSEDCDAMCGGAMCKNSLGQDRCGNTVFTNGQITDGQSCDGSAYQMAKNAQIQAKSAEDNIKAMQLKVSEKLGDTTEVMQAAEEAKDNAESVNKKVKNYAK